MTMPPQDHAKAAAGDIKKEFVCSSGDCADHASAKGQIAIIGRKYATALAGFIAGVIVATIVLYPWLHLLGKLCPASGK